jgi:hypothetical protein
MQLATHGLYVAELQSAVASGRSPAWQHPGVDHPAHRVSVELKQSGRNFYANSAHC